MGKGGGGADVPWEVWHDQMQTSHAARTMGLQAAQREAEAFQRAAIYADQASQQIPAFQNVASQAVGGALNAGNIALGEGQNRRAQQVALLNTLGGVPGLLQDTATLAAAEGMANAGQMRGLAGQLPQPGATAALQGVGNAVGQQIFAGPQAGFAHGAGQQIFAGPQAGMANELAMQRTMPHQVNVAQQALGSMPGDARPGLADASAAQRWLAPIQDLSGAATGGMLPTAEAANRIGQLGVQTGAELAGLRGQTLGTLSQVAEGEVPQAVQDLFTNVGGAERDILERQFQNARSNLMESTGNIGGSLTRNLGALEASRAIAIAQQEAARTNQQREMARGLFGLATEQGLDAPGQQAGLLAQAGGLTQGAEQLRQGGVGLGAGILSDLEAQRRAGIGQAASIEGQLAQQRLEGLGLAGQTFAQIEAQRQAGLEAGAGIYGNLEAQRQAGLGLGADIFAGLEGQRQAGLMGQGQLFAQAEGQRQSGLTGALGALDAAAARDMQARLAQQQGYLTAGQFAQDLAAQYGAGADQLLLNAPNLMGQAAQIQQGILGASGIPAGILAGVNLAPGAGYFGSSASAGGNVTGGMVQQGAGQRASSSAAAGGVGQLIGTLGSAAITGAMLT